MTDKITKTDKIPKYLVFAGATYYPAGGMRDLYGMAETREEALAIATEAIKIGSNYTSSWYHGSSQPLEKSDRCIGDYPKDWAQIAELTTMKIIADLSGTRISWSEMQEKNITEEDAVPVVTIEWHYTSSH
jgi:hypothetical protein